MKTGEIPEKVKGLFGKVGKKTLITVCTVVVLGCAVVLNVILFTNKTSKAPENDFALDLAGTEPTNTQTEPQTTMADYFATMNLNRQQARDEAMEVLLAVAESTTALEEAKQAALGDINKLAAEIETESNIETLILSKGFAQCIAVINNDNCNVIVESDGLLPTEVAQISEIVYEQSGIQPTNLTIIERNTIEG